MLQVQRGESGGNVVPMSADTSCPCGLPLGHVDGDGPLGATVPAGPHVGVRCAVHPADPVGLVATGAQLVICGEVASCAILRDQQL